MIFDFADFMSSVGNVAYADVMKNQEGKSKGCGIVEFTNAADATKAMETLQNSLLDGRNIFIREVFKFHQPLFIVYSINNLIRIEKDLIQEREFLNFLTVLLAEAMLDHGLRTRRLI